MPEGPVLLVEAFSTTQDRLESWRNRLIEATGVQPGSIQVETPTPDQQPVVICYFDGDFGRPRGSPPDSMPNYSRMIVVIDAQGHASTQAVGVIDELPILDPNQTPA